VQGALAPVGCVSQHFYRKCSFPNDQQCAIRNVIKEVRDSIVTILEKVTLAELCHRGSQLRIEPLQSIDYAI
jgi:DNA-binding IscR family transcriptional regulator